MSGTSCKEINNLTQQLNQPTSLVSAFVNFSKSGVVSFVLHCNCCNCRRWKGLARLFFSLRLESLAVTCYVVAVGRRGVFVAMG